MGVWLFSSNSLENIGVAKDRLIWGFWDREAGERQRKNWRQFIKLYNQIKPFDVVVFQIARTGKIHAVGLVRERFYDDQTPVWSKEIDQNRVLYPWRVSFTNMMFSESPFATLFVKIENYVDGYGIGELPKHEFTRLLADLKAKACMEINYEC